MASKPKTIDDYLAALSHDKGGTLEKLRKTIRAAAPKAEECLPAPCFPPQRKNAFGLRRDGEPLRLLPHEFFHVEAHNDELNNYDTSKGTIRFQPDNPLPATLVRKLVKARSDENRG